MEPRPILSPDDRALIAAAQRAFNAGQNAQCADLIRPLLKRNVAHADVLALHAMACARAGNLDEARLAIEGAVTLDRESERFWTIFSDIADAMDDMPALIAGRQSLARLLPEVADHWAALGYAFLRAGEDANADAALQQALTLDSANQRARHNLALIWRNDDRSQEALAVLEPIIAHPQVRPETVGLYNHLLCDLGRMEEGVAGYRALLERHPDQIDTHDTLASLLPQLGEGGVALDAYRKALAKRPDDRVLWLSALASARKLKAIDAFDRLTGEAMRRFASDPSFAVYRADAIGMAGDPWAAARLLEELCAADAGNVGAHISAAYWHLVHKDVVAAEPYARRATELAPMVQSSWAYLGTIWRALGDDRAQWLLDPDRLIQSMTLSPPDGFPSMDAFLAQFGGWLASQHDTLHQPADQSVRSGTQTRGHLFQKREPMIVAFVTSLRAQINTWLATLPMDSSHPFLGRNSRNAGFLTSWSIRMRSSGFHVNHIHQRGWLSSAFYVEVPQEVREQPADADWPAGSLTFGVPDEAIDLGLAPLRIERPAPGKLCLFPSYMWHGTIPFESETPRMTVAFDAVPV